jgi:hypothetical protein
MGDSRDPRFPYPRFLRVPFVFVPRGNPPPVEWIAAHPGYVTISANFVPRPPPETEPEPQPDEPVWEEPESEIEPEVQPQAARPDYLRHVPPPGPKRASGTLPKFSWGDAEARGMNLGRDLCSPAFTRNLVRQTMRLLSDLDRPSVTHLPIVTSDGFSASFRAGMRHLSKHKGDVR